MALAYPIYDPSLMRSLVQSLVERFRDQSKTDPFSLDRSLLTLPGGDHWCIRDACEGTQVFGMTGSGKTSGSGKAISHAFLSAGFGGIVLTAKTDERALWEQWARGGRPYRRSADHHGRRAQHVQLHELRSASARCWCWPHAQPDPPLPGRLSKSERDRARVAAAQTAASGGRRRIN